MSLMKVIDHCHRVAGPGVAVVDEGDLGTDHVVGRWLTTSWTFFGKSVSDLYPWVSSFWRNIICKKKTLVTENNSLLALKNQLAYEMSVIFTANVMSSVWWQGHTLRARINCFSSLSLCHHSEFGIHFIKATEGTQVLSETKLRHFVWPFQFQSIFSPVCADWSAVRATCFPLSIPSPKPWQNMVSNSATCSVMACGRTIWEHATRCNFNRTTKSLSVCVRSDAEELDFMADQVAPSGHRDTCQRPQSLK